MPTKKEDSILSPTTTQPPLWDLLPPELHVHILTYLRAYDLSSVQQTCRYFSSRLLIQSVIKHTAEQVYPQEWTKEVLKQANKEYTFQLLRDMEWCVVARVLSSPEPLATKGGFYISKSWCRTALKWLEVQQQEQKLRAPPTNGKKKKKLSKKEQRQRNRRLSDAMPPWSNVNSDLVCSHSNLQLCGSNKSARARRRLLDKHAWKMLKKLYPDSTAMDSIEGECVVCSLEQESAKREHQLKEERAKQERKKPLTDPLVRALYTRTRGVPTPSLVPADVASKCPLQSGLYHVLSRAWLHQWRRHLKTGEGDPPCVPDASALLCHGHRLPVLPPHLEAYLYGETPQLFWSNTAAKEQEQELQQVEGTTAAVATTPTRAATASHGGVVVGMSPDSATLRALRAAGVSQQELDSQRRLAQLSIQEQPRTPRNNNNTTSRRNTNELLDKENSVVVEILTDDEYTALEKWWPKVHSPFCLRFAVMPDGIEWSTPPCRECDASGKANAVLPKIVKLNQQQLQHQQQHHQQSNQNKKRYHHNKHNKYSVSVDLIDY